MSPELYLREASLPEALEPGMEAIGVCSEAIGLMARKMRHFVFMARDLDPRGANILKQEMLAVGAEAAISYHAISDLTKPTDCLLSGTERQFGIALRKLEKQPFGLRELASELDGAMRVLLGPAPQSFGTLRLDRTRVMGILNVTPDSFSGDGISDPALAAERALAMEKEGADIIDIGGESTRPGAEPVSPKEETARVVPVIKALSGILRIPISIDTRKQQVAEAALKAGASVVNLVGGIRDKRMAEMLAWKGAPVILMHMQGEPSNMQDSPQYRDVMDDIVSELRVQVRLATDAGIDPGKIAIDPGIGFGKTAGHNLEILGRLGELRVLGLPVLVGASRKSFIGKVLDAEVGHRLEGSIAAAVLAAANGAQIVRAHDVAATVRALKVADGIGRIGL